VVLIIRTGIVLAGGVANLTEDGHNAGVLSETAKQGGSRQANFRILVIQQRFHKPPLGALGASEAGVRQPR
jgi:hypothetical protein